jgi:IS30 family transposase
MLCRADPDACIGVNSTTFRTIRLRLNQRPRKTLGFETPASKLQAVASTG